MGVRPAGYGPDMATRFDAQTFGSTDEFLNALSSRLQSADEKEVLVFVHGFANKFVDAVESAAVLAKNSKFPGVIVVFSWPSEGNFLHYFGDEDQVWLSRGSVCQNCSAH
jgi:esterase/lipase superfamily enzyme